MKALPPGWTWSTLGEVSQKPQYGWTTKADPEGAGVRLLRTTDITSGAIDWSCVPACTEEPADVAKYLLADDDIVVSRAGSVGASIRVTSPPPAVFASYLIRLRVIRVESAYVAWFLCSRHYWNQIQEVAAGIALLNVNAKKLAAISMPLPPLYEQLRIVAAIEEHLSRLDAADISLATARRRLQTLLRPIRQRAVESGQEGTVGDLVDDIEAGKSFKCHGRPADPGEWGVVKVSAMTWGSFREGENKAVLSDERVDPHWEIRPDDLLLSRANTTEYVGASVLVGECRRGLLLSDKSMRLLVKDGVDRTWLQHALSAPTLRAQMSAVATGTSDSMRNISQEKVKSLRLRVPPIEEQRRIVAEVEERLSVIDAMRASIASAQRRSAALRASILERAFRGELVPQDPSDEPASVLLDGIRAERAMSESATGRRRNAVRP